MSENKWVGLAYVIPATPSRGRVFVWRHLKGMGARIIKPGLAALPNTPSNIKKFSLLASKIETFTGQASLLEFNFHDETENKLLEKEFELGKDETYESMLKSCKNIIDDINKAENKEERKILEEKLLTTIREFDKKSDTSILSAVKKDMGDAAVELLTTLKSMPAEIISALKKKE